MKAGVERKFSSRMAESVGWDGLQTAANYTNKQVNQWTDGNIARMVLAS
jgi:hypothetical protein